MAGYKTIENRDRQVWLIDIHIKKMVTWFYRPFALVITEVGSMMDQMGKWTWINPCHFWLLFLWPTLFLVWGLALGFFCGFLFFLFLHHVPCSIMNCMCHLKSWHVFSFSDFGSLEVEVEGRKADMIVLFTASWDLL